MIHIYLDENHDYTLEGLFEDLPELRARIALVPYQALMRKEIPRLGPGLHILCDIERMDAPTARSLRQIMNKVGAAFGPRARFLNDPAWSMRRYELLRSRHRAGLGRFDVRRVVELEPPSRWPVFIRGENDHLGPIGGLIHDEVDYERRIRGMRDEGVCLEDKLIVEFLDTADADGIYRKYSAFRVADRLIPRHLFSSDQWMIKHPDRLDAEAIDEEVAFVHRFPHRNQVWEAFEAARIEYGRIDYAVLDGQIEVWEINTNPFFTSRKREGREDRRYDLHRRFLRDFVDALCASDPVDGSAE